MLVDIDVIEMEGAIAGIDLHAVLLHVLIITMQQEMHLLSAISQLAAVIAAMAPTPIIPYKNGRIGIDFLCA